MAPSDQGCSRTVEVTLPVNDLLGPDMGGVTTPDRSGPRLVRQGGKVLKRGGVGGGAIRSRMFPNG